MLLGGVTGSCCILTLARSSGPELAHRQDNRPSTGGMSWQYYYYTVVPLQVRPLTDVLFSSTPVFDILQHCFISCTVTKGSEHAATMV